MDACTIEYTHQTEEGVFSIFMRFLDNLADKSFDVTTAGICCFCFLGFFVVFPIQTLCWTAGFMALFGLLLLSSGLFSNYPIITSQDGITWSPLHALSLRFRFTRPWIDISAVEFTRDRFVSNTPDCICIVYKDGCDVQLRLAGFTKKNLELLLLLIRNHCPQAKWLPSDENVRLISPSTAPINPLSFTGLWLDEIGSRLGSTAFVPLDPGSMLQDGRIKVIGQIALGGLSAIYLAQTDEKRTCVLKESVVPFSSEDEARKTALELFKREAQLLARIDHPRIARIYDFFIEDDHHYLLMEYLEGRNLRQFVQEHGPQKENMAIVWAKQIADILAYLHAMEPPIIHRDLTPDNLIVEEDGSISLIDFGAANQFLSTATGTIIGKTSYMSLEQFRGKSSPPCDIFSFGCTLQFLLLGIDPEPFSYSSTATGRNDWKTLQELIRECKHEDLNARPTAQAIADRLGLLMRERGEGKQ
ncbi:MAG: serine/threonine protein kinase [Candidatus Melainabacteria bacterium]|nr:serine/threonine protein kinase [Candidatus Melainabacteria bacterium]